MLIGCISLLLSPGREFIFISDSFLSPLESGNNFVMARFAVSILRDQSAAVWIITFLLLSYTTLTFLVRGYVKF